jgi:prophage regulatory protein
MEKPKRILRLSDVQDRVGLGRSTIYLLISKREFPRPIPLTGKAVGFAEDEVEAWVEARIAKRPPVREAA